MGRNKISTGTIGVNEKFYIRVATLHDLDEMHTLLKKSTRDWTLSILRDCFSDDYFLWAICSDNKILGFAVIQDAINHWELMQIVIDKKYQRQGLAAQLLQFVINEAKTNKIKKIQLEVRSSNDAAITLYLKFGFHTVGVRKRYYADGEDASLMDLEMV